MRLEHVVVIITSIRVMVDCREVFGRCVKVTLVALIVAFLLVRYVVRIISLQNVHLRGPGNHKACILTAYLREEVKLLADLYKQENKCSDNGEQQKKRCCVLCLSLV